MSASSKSGDWTFDSFGFCKRWGRRILPRDSFQFEARINDQAEENRKGDIKKKYEGSDNCPGEKQKELVHLHLLNHINKYQQALKDRERQG